jgi:hypothetical protein
VTSVDLKARLKVGFKVMPNSPIEVLGVRERRWREGVKSGFARRRKADRSALILMC